jgi:isocitrate dehydrogenase
MNSSKTVTLIYGDGIGPEVVGATRKIIDATGVKINWEVCEAGAEVFKKGIASGVTQETLDSIQRTRLVLKGPLETPVGFGEKSANVTLRKLFETYANVRPVREFPGLDTPYKGRNIDFVIVRENVEDLYAGIEHMQTPGVAQTLKLISRKGCEKIVRFAFELARSEGRKSVHCATKANIMKFSEGMLKRAFEDIAQEYPEIKAEHIIVDNCAHQMVRTPELFDVIVTTNMNGDILSDLGSGLVGGLGFAPGANLGSDIAMFEAVHGSAPKLAGQNKVNPLAVLMSGVMMLRYIGEFDAAHTIEQAVLYTLESGVYTYDVRKDGSAVQSTVFTDTIIANFGKTSNAWRPREYKKLVVPAIRADLDYVKPAARQTLGLDVFVEANVLPDALGTDLEKLLADLPLTLKGINSRGVKVYPKVGGMLPDLVDHYQCRFMMQGDEDLTDALCLTLLERIGQKYRWMHIEKLQAFDGQAGFTKAQGED